MSELYEYEVDVKEDSPVRWGRALKIFWVVCLIIVAVGVISLTFAKDISFAQHYKDTILLMVLLAFMALFAEYIDSSIGMGYGTTLTPILLIMGFSPLQIVPSVLLSQCICGLLGGGMHHRVGNVNLSWGTRANKIMTVMALCSIVGTVAAVILALSLPKSAVKLYIGLMILGIGIFILVGQNIMGKFSWGKIVGLGTVAAFNKGISGGGYGPLVTGGQVMFGIPGKNAVGITSLAEGLVCVVGFVLYVVLYGFPSWRLMLPLVGGAIFSVPLAAFTVKILPEESLRKGIGIATVFLGTLTLIKLVL